MRPRARIPLLAALLAPVAPAATGCVRPAGGLAPAPAPPAKAAAPPAPGGPAWFEDRTKAAGIAFTMGHGGRSPLPILEVMGPGCGVLDYDGDKRPDVFLVGQDNALIGAPNAGNARTCALYRNQGDGTFKDVTAGSGLDAPGYYMGCSVGDLDNDGRPDILVTGYGINRLFRNLGGGKFRDVTQGSGLEAEGKTVWYSASAFGDYDRDGRLDLYLGRYVRYDDTVQKYCAYGKKAEIKASCGPNFHDPQVGQLFRNAGGFRFKDVSAAAGVEGAHGKCLGAAFADVNGDGWPDLYLGNDEMPGDLFVNEGGKRFRNDALVMGVALAGDGSMQGAMGVDFADYNNDLRPDLVVTTYQYEPKSLYAATPDGLFENASLANGLGQATREFVGFGTKFVDVDNDGWLDLPIANGHIHDNQEAIDAYSTYRQPVQLFMSAEGGARFEEKTAQAGPGFTTPCAGRGLAVADFDADGRQDLLVSDVEGPPRLLLNRYPDAGNWLRVRLEGTKSPRDGAGARVTLYAGGKKWAREAGTGGSYFSASDPAVHFGLGALRAVERVEVAWPSGRKSRLASPPVGREIALREP